MIQVMTYCAKEKPNFPHFPNEKYYLIDSGYPTKTCYLGPHRYHVDQFNRGVMPISTQEFFNRKYFGLRFVTETNI